MISLILLILIDNNKNQLKNLSLINITMNKQIMELLIQLIDKFDL